MSGVRLVSRKLVSLFSACRCGSPAGVGAVALATAVLAAVALAACGAPSVCGCVPPTPTLPPGRRTAPQAPAAGNALLESAIDDTQDPAKIAADRNLVAGVYGNWASRASDCLVVSWADSQGFRVDRSWSDLPCTPDVPPLQLPCVAPPPPSSSFDTQDWGPYDSCVNAAWKAVDAYNAELAQRRDGNAAAIRNAAYERDPQTPDLGAAVYKLAELARVQPADVSREMLLVGGFSDSRPDVAPDLKSTRVVVVLDIDDRAQYERTKAALTAWLTAAGAQVTVDDMGTSPRIIADQLSGSVQPK